MLDDIQPITFDMGEALALATDSTINSSTAVSSSPAPTSMSQTSQFAGKSTVSTTSMSQSSQFASTTVSAILNSERSITTSPTTSPTSPALALTHRNAVPVALVIGVVLAVCLIVTGIATLLWYRRRRRQHAFVDLSTTPFTTNNEAPNNSDSRTISTVRRWYLHNELRSAQEKIANIQQDRYAPSPQGGFRRVSFSNGGSDTGRRSPDLDMLAQLRELTERIRELEAQMRSPWALGLSDESPPGYSEAES
ncbi:hypothetical protein MVEN_02188700 [Mycena venus]|uniref:Mid2 domain-containing protein n=1 Tax=Mycena venus TaxID=2733690 RepID=A0A8H7CGE6_9AGAR|nr:hypothetical protein MVEN_02188700 [Mycena venus]